MGDNKNGQRKQRQAKSCKEKKERKKGNRSVQYFWYPWVLTPNCVQQYKRHLLLSHVIFTRDLYNTTKAGGVKQWQPW